MNRKLAILSGSFNPLHDGHREMLRIAEARLKCPVHYELSIANVDKPSLDPDEVERRLRQFGEVTCWVTRAPTFLEKARIFPGATFVVGGDTIARISDEKYYDGRLERMISAINEISSSGCRFLVFGRTINENFVELPSIGVHAELESICDWIAESEFRVDIASTQIRKKNDPR